MGRNRREDVATVWEHATEGLGCLRRVLRRRRKCSARAVACFVCRRSVVVLRRPSRGSVVAGATPAGAPAGPPTASIRGGTRLRPRVPPAVGHPPSRHATQSELANGATTEPLNV